MAWVIHEFHCANCEHEFDEFYRRSERPNLICPMCGKDELTQLISAPNIATFSIMSTEQQKESLMKRSAKHTQQQIDKEPERWGAAGKARATRKIKR